MERQRKRELRELNNRAWAGEKDVFVTVSSPDSSLKKNTALIKRIRTGIAGNSTASYLQDIKALSLHKYLSELVSACYEGLCKLKSPVDVAAGVEIMSALHQRFGPADFTMSLGWYLGRGLATPEKSQLKALSPELREKEEKERLIRQRSLLKVVTELWLVGVLKSLEDTAQPEEIAGKGKDGTAAPSGRSGEKPKTRQEPAVKTTHSEPFPLEALKDILPNDRDHAALAMIVTYVKTYSWDILGVKGAAEQRQQLTVEEVSHDEMSSADEQAPTVDPVIDPPLTDVKLQEMFRNVLQQYLEGVKAHVVKDQQAVVNQGKRNAEVYVKSGEVFEDRQSHYEKQIKTQEKLVANAQTLCEVLDSEMPDLKGDDGVDEASNSTIGLVKTSEYLRGQGEGAGIWEDEEERRFYENLIDLKDRVPGILLEDGKKKKPDNDSQVGKRNDVEEEEQIDKEKTAEADDQSTAIANKTVGAQVDALLARLPELQTRDSVDQFAMDFCFLNSKASRNRLLKQIQDIPKGRTDLYPLYARLVATVSKYMQDVSTGLVTYLNDEFRSLQRRKAKEFLTQARSGNVRYLAELTKFGVVPEHVIFHCLKVALDEFSRMNIEIIANLLENCGKYLLRNPETSPRMRSFLDTLKRKKTAQHLSQQDRMLLENAMYYVDPPQRAAIEQKERTPTELYIRKLIYLDLGKRTFGKVLKSLRKLHWEESEVVDILEKVFSKPHRLKYGNVQYLAFLVWHLQKYHSAFVISVVDNLLENIVLGLERNDFRFNQRRVAEMKYFAEFYIYRILDSEVVFETLYQIIRFGHAENFPSPDSFNPLDQSSDYFRLRLICTTLDTCGQCFERGPAKKKLDCFLSFFEYYIHTKEPAPQDITFMIEHTFHLWRPKWEFAPDVESAYRKFLELRAQNFGIESQEPETADQELLDDDNASFDGDVEDLANGNGDESQGSDVDEDDELEGDNKLGSDSEPEIIVTRQEEERDPEAEAEFDRELAKLMADSVDSRRLDRKPQFDVPLPMRKGPKDVSVDNEQQDNSTPQTAPNMIAFSLMTKKGSKAQTRTIELPSNSTFAQAMRTQQEAERAEQQRIKNLVLNYDLQDNGDQDGSYDKYQHNAPLLQSSHHHGGRSNDKGVVTKNGQRTRKLQLSDVNWT